MAFGFQNQVTIFLGKAEAERKQAQAYLILHIINNIGNSPISSSSCQDQAETNQKTTLLRHNIKLSESI